MGGGWVGWRFLPVVLALIGCWVMLRLLLWCCAISGGGGRDGWAALEAGVSVISEGAMGKSAFVTLAGTGSRQGAGSNG